MQDVYYNDTPRKAEIGQPVTGFGFAGQYEPITVGVCPLVDLGKVTRLDQRSHRAGHDSGRSHFARLRFLSADARVGRRRGLHDHAAAGSSPRDGRHAKGDHAPLLAHRASGRRHQAGPLSWQDHDHARAWRADATLPVEYRVYPGTLDPIDVPVGPYAHEINIPWDGIDPAADGMEPHDGRAQPAQAARLRLHLILRDADHPLSRLQSRQTAI